MLPSRLPRGLDLVDRRRRVLVGAPARWLGLCGVIVGRGLPITGTVAIGHISGPAPFLVVSETTFDGGADPPSFVATTR